MEHFLTLVHNLNKNSANVGGKMLFLKRLWLEARGYFVVKETEKYKAKEWASC